MPENDKTTGADDNGQEQTEEKGQASTDAEVTETDPEQPEPPLAATPAIGSTKAGTKNNTQKAKKAADGKRRKDVIDNQPPQPEPSEADVKNEARKADIQDQLTKLHIEEVDHLAVIDEIKEKRRDLMAELYPHMVKSDQHCVAVRGYIDSQKKIRAARATDPVRFAAMLKQAGKAPIDAAFSKQRARGANRPVRNASTGKPATEKQE